MAYVKNVLQGSTSLPLKNEASSSDHVVGVAHRDYAGAHPKTDPQEIRLVRKLDYRIMVRASFYPPIMGHRSDSCLF